MYLPLPADLGMTQRQHPPCCGSRNRVFSLAIRRLRAALWWLAASACRCERRGVADSLVGASVLSCLSMRAPGLPDGRMLASAQDASPQCGRQMAEPLQAHKSVPSALQSLACIGLPRTAPSQTPVQWLRVTRTQASPHTSCACCSVVCALSALSSATTTACCCSTHHMTCGGQGEKGLWGLQANRGCLQADWGLCWRGCGL